MSAISLVLPTLNGENELPGLLAAPGAQSRPADEIVVVDSSSDDNTCEVAARGNGESKIESGPANNKQPLVGVIVPTYKRADRLGAALHSIFNQTYKNIEVVVVNDNIPGSFWDEATEGILSSMNDSRLRVVHTTGEVGGGAARNYACRHTHGEYLAFLDDDDEFEKDKIETQLDFMVSNKLDMSWQDVSWYNESGKLVEHRRLDHCRDFSQEGLLRAHLRTPIAPTSIYMIRKDLFDRTDGFGEVRTGQDWWLMLRCIEAGAKVGYMPEVHVRQYIHGGQRLSLGLNKIKGEEQRHAKVREYYPMLSKKEINYIEFRHNAVLAFACARGGRISDAVRYAFKTIRSSPITCIKEGFSYAIRAKK